MNLTLRDYVAQNYGALMAEILYGNDTAMIAAIMPNVKGKTTVPNVFIDPVLQAGVCNEPLGEPTIGDYMMEVEPIQMLIEYCSAELQKKLSPDFLMAGSNNLNDLGTPIEEAMMDQLVAGIGVQIEYLRWQGDKTSGDSKLDKIDGFFKKITEANTAIDGSIAGVTELTIDNIMGVIDHQIDKMPLAISRSRKALILASDDTFRLYINALKNANRFHEGFENNGSEIVVGGYNIKLKTNIGFDGTSRILTTIPDNLILGSDVEKEQDTLKVTPSEFHGKTRIETNFKLGVLPINIPQMVNFTLSA